MAWDILITGASTSGVYAMLAVGFTLIFGVARVLNFAHGSFFAIAAYSIHVCAVIAGMPLLLAGLVSLLVVSVYAAALDRFLIRPLRGTSLAILMTTLAMSMLVEQGLLIAFGSDSRSVPSLTETTIHIGDADIPGQRVMVIAGAIVSVAGLLLFLNQTKLGSAILAVAQDPTGARYVGISADRIYRAVIILSALLAAVAAFLAVPTLSVQPGMGGLLMVKAFCIVIVGGLGSIVGSICAAIFIGYAETIVAFGLSTAWQELVALIAVFMALIIRPNGLFGVKQA